MTCSAVSALAVPAMMGPQHSPKVFPDLQGQRSSFLISLFIAMSIFYQNQGNDEKCKGNPERPVADRGVDGRCRRGTDTYLIHHCPLTVDKRLAVRSEEPRRLPGWRDCPRDTAVADANHRESRLNRPRNRLPGVLLGLDRIREPAVVCNEEQHLSPVPTELAHQCRIGVFKANGDA